MNVHVKPLTHKELQQYIRYRDKVSSATRAALEQVTVIAPERRRSGRQSSKSIEITINFWFLGLNSITTYNHHHHQHSTGRLLSYMGGLVK